MSYINLLLSNIYTLTHLPIRVFVFLLLIDQPACNKKCGNFVHLSSDKLYEIFPKDTALF